MKIYSPDNWPANAPAYHSPEGWEHQKRIQRTNLVTEISTIPWLVEQQTEKHLRIATRLAEIVNHPLADYFRSQIDALDFVKNLTGEGEITGKFMQKTGDSDTLSETNGDRRFWPNVTFHKVSKQ